MNYSITIAGIIATLITSIAKTINYELPVKNEEISTAILTIIQLGGLLVAYIGRVRHGDITWYGKRIERLEVHAE